MRTESNGNYLHSRAFSNGGMYVMRAGVSYILFVAHKVGVFSTGPHKHNDTLSFEWCLGDQPIIVDSGTGCYTGDLSKKNLYRSTGSHNTVVIDGEEQIPIDGIMFALNNITGDVKVTSWCDDEHESQVTANHTFYGRLPEPVVHQRTIVLDKLTHHVTIEDEFSGSGSHKMEWYFHLDPSLTATFTDNHFIINSDAREIATIRCPDVDLDADVIPGFFSRSFNEEIKSEVLHCKITSQCDVDKAFTFHLIPTL